MSGDAARRSACATTAGVDNHHLPYISLRGRNTDMRRWFVLLALTLPIGADQLVYQKPPKEILDILNAPALPALSVNPTRTYAALSATERYPGIDEVAAPMLRLAGIRIDPKTNGLHLAPFSSSITLVKLPEGTKIPVALPLKARAGATAVVDPMEKCSRSPTPPPPESSCGSAIRQPARHIALKNLKLNAVLGDPIDWLADNKTLLVKTVPANRKPAPAEPRVPKGPAVQESDGHGAGVATYEDLLENPHDEDLFEYYSTVATGSRRALPATRRPRIGKPGILDEVTPSPDGKNVLITREHRPFSYLHPYREFPKEVEVWTPNGALAYKVASLPLPVSTPVGGVQTGPRTIRWAANHPATVFWVRSHGRRQSEGESSASRQASSASKAPFKGEPVEVFKTEERFSGIQFGKDFALVAEQAASRICCGPSKSKRARSRS